MIPQPKYSIGQTVFYASTLHTTTAMQCPDCLGTRKWKAITPAGTEVETECGRCGSWASRDLPSLMRAKWAPSTQRLTIGSVRINTADEHPVEYMCVETGVGSGSVYDEHLLFEDEAAAKASAQLKANEQNAKIAEKPEVVYATKVGQLRLTEATLENARKQIWDSWWCARRFKEDIERIVEDWDSSSKDEIKYSLEHALDWENKNRDPHPIDDLIHKLDKFAARTWEEPAYADAADEVRKAILKVTMTEPAKQPEPA